MTKEELEKEAEEYTKISSMEYSDSLVDIDDIDVLKEAIAEAYLAGTEPREKRIAELEAQIEKMKCCVNCKHSRTEYEHCRTNKHEKWEIKQ